jgi:glycosyltransferase involved in cell wall biosynthesis
VRILVLTNLYPNPFQPNRATFNRQQLRALAERHEVSVIAPILWTDETRAKLRGQKDLPANRKIHCDGLSVMHPRYFYTPYVFRSLYGRFFECSVRSTFYQRVNEFKPDLVFAPWVYPDGWAAVRLATRVRLPVVLKAHGSDVLLSGDYRGRMRRTAEALRSADGVVTVSRDIARRTTEAGAADKRVRVVYDGVDTTKFRPGPRDEARNRLGLSLDARVALFIGNVLPVKGVDVLINACNRLAKDQNEFVCYVIGEGPLRHSLSGRVEALGLSERVKFLGAMPHASLPDWYRAANVFVLPSRSEGVPCVLLEALACGTPFVASRVGGIPEIADFGPSRLVTPGDGEELALAIAELFVRPWSCGSTMSRTHADAATELGEFFEEIVALHKSGLIRQVRVDQKRLSAAQHS